MKKELKLSKLYDEIQIRQKEFVDSVVVSNVLNTKQFYMSELVSENKKRDNAFLFNKLNTIREISEEKFNEAVFITLTSNSEGVKRAKIDYKFNKDISNSFNSLFRMFFKGEVFRNELTSDKRLYISVNEFTKGFVLHRHFLQYLFNEEQALRYVDRFSSIYLKKKEELNLGRCEIVVSSSVYSRLVSSDLLKTVSLGNEKVLMFKEENKRSGNFLYFKKLKENDNSKGLTSYIMKYVMKNINGENKTNFEKACSYLHSSLKIRRFNFSRYVFPKSLYYNLVNDRNVPIYKLFSLKELTTLKNSGKLFIEYNNLLKQKKEKESYNKYILDKVFNDFINETLTSEIEINKVYENKINEKEELILISSSFNEILCYNSIEEIERLEFPSVLLQNFLSFSYTYNFDSFEYKDFVSVDIGGLIFKLRKKEKWLFLRS